MSDAFFLERPTSGGSLFDPQASAASTWAGGSTIRGMASSGLLARAAEQVAAARVGASLRPVRWTVDLSRPVPMSALTCRALVQHAGRRVLLIDAALLDGHQTVARARGVWLAPGGEVVGRSWTDLPAGPVPARQPAAQDRLYFSEGVGWTASADDHHNAERKALWQRLPEIVDGEQPTPLLVAAAAADLASVVCHWGERGLLFVNVDLSLALSREPVGREVGLTAELRDEQDGLAVGTATLRDRLGPFGWCSTSALAAGDRAVDPGARDVAS